MLKKKNAYNEMLQKLPIFSIFHFEQLHFSFHNKPAKSVSINNKVALNEKQKTTLVLKINGRAFHLA